MINLVEIDLEPVQGSEPCFYVLVPVTLNLHYHRRNWRNLNNISGLCQCQYLVIILYHSFTRCYQLWKLDIQSLSVLILTIAYGLSTIFNYMKSTLPTWLFT